MEQERARGASADSGPAEGADSSGAVTIRIDGAHRLVGVRLSESANIRKPEALSQSFAEAYSAALAAQLESARKDRPRREPGQRPRAVATEVTFQRPTLEQLSRHRVRLESRHLPRAHAGVAMGVSSNKCVQVTLDPAQPVGEIVAEPGWLANASLDNLTRAITEAFQGAYSERDKS